MQDSFRFKKERDEVKPASRYQSTLLYRRRHARGSLLSVARYPTAAAKEQKRNLAGKCFWRFYQKSKFVVKNCSSVDCGHIIIYVRVCFGCFG